jgi:hypothetical protein
MFSTRTLAELEARRQQLLAASEAQRTQFCGSLAELTAALGWVDRVTGWAHQVSSLLWVAAPAAGFFAARRARTALRLVTMVVPWWRIVRRLVGRFGPKKT